MKAAPVTILLLLSASACWGDVHFEIQTSGYAFDAATGGFTSDPITKQTQFTLKGHAKAKSKELEFTADTVKGIIGTPKGAHEAVLQHAETFGRSTVKRRANVGGKTETTVITGSRFSFDGDQNLGKLKLIGPVTITDTGSDQTVIKMMGKSGLAQFDMRKQKADQALIGATLDDDITIDVQEAGTKKGHLIATGDHVVLDRIDTQNHNPQTRIVLTGKINMHGEGDSQAGIATGVPKLTIIVDAKGKLTRVSAGDVSN